MKVRQLIKLLNEMPPDQEVLLASMEGESAVQISIVRKILVRNNETNRRKGVVAIFDMECGQGVDYEQIV